MEEEKTYRSDQLGPVVKSAEAWRQCLQAPSSFAGSKTSLAWYFCPISLIPETVFPSIHVKLIWIMVDIVKIWCEPVTKEARFGTFHRLQEPAYFLGVCKCMFHRQAVWVCLSYAKSKSNLQLIALDLRCAWLHMHVVSFSFWTWVRFSLLCHRS